MEKVSTSTVTAAEARASLTAPKLGKYRRLTQTAFILFIFFMPVLDILRYDSATKELFLFGQVWTLGLKHGFYADHSVSGAAHIALHFFLKAIFPWVLVLSIFPILGYFTGRLFCGWLCPEGALFEWADYLTLKILGRRSLYGKKANDPEGGQEHRILFGVIALLSAVVIPLAGGIALTGYFIAPKTVWNQIVHWDFTFGVKAGIIGVSIYMLIGSVLVRHTFCKYVCAAGLMQMLLGWISPVSLRMKMDSARLGECTDCRGCEKACFMNVLPRKNRRDISCVNCGACVDACNKELNGRGLFHYAAGDDMCIGPSENCPSSVRNTLLGTK